MQGNKVVLVGYVGKDVNCRKLANGIQMAGIRLATHYKQKGKGDEYRVETTWHDIVAWNSTAAFAERSFVKGSRIMVEGLIVYRNYKDKTGHTRYVTQIKAQSLINLDR